MTSSSLRATLFVCTLLGLAAGCASRNPSSASPARPKAVAPEDIERNTGEPIEKLLESRNPGIQVTRTAGGGIAVQIQGVSSFSGNQPLVVIDDAPMEAGPGGALIGVNPHDIVSIKVLKNPADPGIYGMRGANGVIVVKTKRPGRRS